MIINSANVNKTTITSHLNWTHCTQKDNEVRNPGHGFGQAGGIKPVTSILASITIFTSADFHVGSFDGSYYSG